MHRIAIHRIERHFLAIEKHRLRRDRTGCHDVTIGEDQAALGIDDEAGRLARHVPLGVEGARLIHLDGDDAAGHALERSCPAGIFGGGDRHHRGRCIFPSKYSKRRQDQKREAGGFIHSYKRTRGDLAEREDSACAGGLRLGERSASRFPLIRAGRNPTRSPAPRKLTERPWIRRPSPDQIIHAARGRYGRRRFRSPYSATRR